MEGTPPAAENDKSAAETKDTKKSKKRAGEFGALLVEAKEPAKVEAEVEKPRKRLFDFFAKEPAETAAKLTIEKDTDADKALEKLAKDVEPADETEAPTEAIGIEEAHDSTKLLAQERPIETEALSINARPAEQLAAEAIDGFHDKIVEDDKDVNQAFAEIMSELGLSPDEITAVESEPVVTETPAAPTEFNIDHSEPTSEDDAAASLPIPPAPPAGPPPETFQPSPEPEPDPLPLQFRPSPVVAPVAPESPTHITSGNVNAPEYDRGNPAVTALVGGIVGYLIGRRRGRIKTEKKLLPIQKKLQKEVEDLEWQLADKESKIRRAAVRAAEKDPAVVSGGLFAIGKYNTLREQRRGKNAEQLHAAPHAPERIGQVLMAAEPERGGSTTTPEAKPEALARAVTDAERASVAANGRRVETMNRTDLLALSEQIIIDGSSLRQIYETHLIGEQGLRRLVAEHLQGGDLKQALRREIVEHEIDFERDPGLRDMKVADDITGGGAVPNSKATLDKMVEQASANLPNAHTDAARYQAHTAQTTSDRQRQQRHRRLLDISLISIITILIAVVITLYLSRT